MVSDPDARMSAPRLPTTGEQTSEAAGDDHDANAGKKRCPDCGTGWLHLIEILRPSSRPRAEPLPIDSS